MHKFSENSEE